MSTIELEEKNKVEELIWGVTEQMVEQALKSVKVGKAPGHLGLETTL